MAIVVCLDDILEQQHVSVTQLAEAVGITRVNMSLLKTGKIKAVRLSTLDGICAYLHCQPGDIFKYREDSVPDGDAGESADVPPAVDRELPKGGR